MVAVDPACHNEVIGRGFSMSTVELMQPLDFFRTQVCAAASNLQVELDSSLEFYLVNLLCEFINPALLHIEPDINVLDTPLAFILKKAVESTPDTQIKVYKRLGDTSLYIAGYFQDYFNRKTYDVGYYISMGSAAYGKTSVLMRSQRNDTHFAQMYAGLSQDFRKLVAILAQVASTMTPHQQPDLLQTYLNWQQTQSESLRRTLDEHDILPVPLGSSKDPQ